MIAGRSSPSPPPSSGGSSLTMSNGSSLPTSNGSSLPPKRRESSVLGTLSTSSPSQAGAHHRRTTSRNQSSASRSIRSKSPGTRTATSPSASASAGGGSSSPSGRRLERLSADLGVALEDEDLADVRLRCADAPEDGSMDLLAVRAILAVRSRIFKRLLYVTSPEEHAHQDDTVKDGRGRLLVRIGGGLTTGVLRLAVEYCYTGKLSAKVAGTTVEDKIRTQVAAIQAASYLALPEWSCDVEHDVLTRICKHRSLACAVLDEAARLAITAADSRIVDAAWSLIRLCPQQALLPSSSPSAAELFPVSNSNSSQAGAANSTSTTPTTSNRNKSSPGRTRANSVGSVQEMTAATSVVRAPSSVNSAAATAIAVAPGAGVLALGPAVLRQVISDRKSNANEITLFRCLQRWVSNEEDEKKKPEVKKEEGDTARQLFPSGDSPEQEGQGQGRGRAVEPAQEDTLLSLRRNDMGAASRRAFVSQLLSEGGVGDDGRPGRGGVLDLSEIAPSDLCTVVMPSSLVPQSQLMQAFQRQALEAELRGVLSLRKRRSTFAKNASRAVVSGAGSDLVNGTYRLVESVASPQPTFPQYTRTCTFRGRKRRLMLLRSPGKDCDDVFWWIVIKHDVDGREMESGRDWICFYISSRLTPLKGKPRNDEEEDAYDPVPHVWLSFDSWHGVKPPPVVVWT